MASVAHTDDVGVEDALPVAPDRQRPVVLGLIGVGIAVGLGVWQGLVVSASQGFLVAAGAVAVLLLGTLALFRIEWFVWVVLVGRPIADIGKTGGPAAGSGPAETVIGGAVILVGFLYLASLSHARQRLPMGIVSRSLVLLMVSSLISVAFSWDPLTSALQVARTFGAVMMLLVLEQMVRSLQMAKRALGVCALSAIVPLAIGLGQLVLGSQARRAKGLGRVTGTFTHPNSFGLFLAVLLLMGLALLPYVSRRVRWALTVVVLVAAVELVATYARGGWLVFGLGLLLMGVLADRRILLAVPVLAAVGWFAIPSVRTRLSDLSTADTVGGLPSNSASWRVQHIEQLLSFRGADRIVGIGPMMSDRLTAGGRQPHNDAVRMFVENGTVGLICYLFFLLALVVLAVRALRRLRSGFGRGLAVGFAASVLAFLVDSMVDNLITQFVLLIYVLALAAVVQAWIRYSTDEPFDEDLPARRQGGSRPHLAVGIPDARTREGER